MTRSRIARWTLIALTIIPALGLVACGGGSSGGSDSSYVAAICAAELKFTASINAVMSDPKTLSDPKALTDPTFLSSKLGASFDQFAKDFANAKPPSDIKDWHNSTAKQFSDMAAQLKSGKDMSTLFGATSPAMPDPPAEAQARLAKVAATNKDCVASGTFIN
jgi:hypothetical protein